MRVTITVNELAGLTARELMALYHQVSKEIVATRMHSPGRHAVEQTLANIRFVLAWRHRMPR